MEVRSWNSHHYTTICSSKVSHYFNYQLEWLRTYMRFIFCPYINLFRKNLKKCEKARDKHYLDYKFSMWLWGIRHCVSFSWSWGVNNIWLDEKKNNKKWNRFQCRVVASNRLMLKVGHFVIFVRNFFSFVIFH